MRLGTLRTPVTLWRRPKTSGDSDGYEEALTPSAWWCAIVPYQGQTDIRATVSQIIMRWHPQVDVDTIIRVPPVSFGYANRVVADGASAYWRLNEASGLLAVDSVGTNHGTISGGVTLGQPGALVDGSTAMAFDGATGQIVTGAPVTIPLVATVEGWVRLAPGLVGQHPFFSVGQLGVTGFYLGVTRAGVPPPTGVKTFAHAFSGGSGSRNLDDGQWHAIAYVLNGVTVTTYIDGIVDATVTIGRTAPTTAPGVIGFNGDTTEWWLGALDEVAIYPHALTPTQIAEHSALRTAFPRRERQIHVLGVQDVENRHTELLLTCEEVWP